MLSTQDSPSWPGERSRREFLKNASLAAAWLALPTSWAVVGRPDLRPAKAYDAGVALTWFDFALHLVKTTPGYSPPVASRTFAYLGIGLYETLVPGMPGNRSLQGKFPNLQLPTRSGRDSHMYWPAAANAAIAAVARGLFPTTSAANLAAIDQLETSLNTASDSVSPVLVADSVSWGKDVAAAILQWSASDGGHEGYLRNFPSSYIPPQGPGLWVPTAPGFQGALQPYWGQNRTFAVSSGAECVAPDHPTFSVAVDSDFYRDAVEVYEAVNGITAEQTEIAQFWSDDPGNTATPPGHSISILNQVINAEELDLAEAAECYLKVGIAVSDAFVTCWNTKYRTNLIRPISYIRDLIDNQWTPILSTPPFPEFTSGHSVQSGAAFGVMADLFGDDYQLVDHTHDDRGLTPRVFTSFSGCAEEAAVSRLYGGIHYRPAIDLGVAQGRCVADAVERLPLRAGKRA